MIHEHCCINFTLPKNWDPKILSIKAGGERRKKGREKEEEGREEEHKTYRAARATPAVD